MLNNQIIDPFSNNIPILNLEQQKIDKQIFKQLHEATALASQPILCSRYSYLSKNKGEVSDFMDWMSYQVAGGMWATIISYLYREHTGQDVLPCHVFSAKLLGQIHSDLSHFGLTNDDIALIMQYTFKTLLKEVNTQNYTLPQNLSINVQEYKNYLNI